MNDKPTWRMLPMLFAVEFAIASTNRPRSQLLRRLTHIVSAFSLSRERGQRLLRIRWVPPDCFVEIGRNDARGVVAAQPGDVASGVR